MKSEIMIRILFILLAKKRVTAEELSNRFGICKRSVYRYLDELSLAVPIYAERGSMGGYSIVENFRLPATFLTEKEYAVLIKSLEAIKSEVRSDALNSAMDKIRANSKNALEISLNSSTLMIDSGPWGVTQENNNKLKVLQECVEKNLTVAFKYYNVDGNASERTVEPHTLVLKQGIWYIYAYCRLRGDFRLFKVGRISSMIVGGETFERKDISDIKNVFSYRDYSSYKEEVVFEVEESVCAEVEEWLGVECFKGYTGENCQARQNLQNDEECAKKAGNYHTARAVLPVDSGLVSKIMSFGGKVKVLYPQTLKDQIMKSAMDMLNCYR